MNLSTPSLALVCLTFLFLAINPVISANVAFTADLTAPTTPVSGVLYDSFGSSHGSTTLRSTWRDHLTTTKSDIPFNRVRFHGILDDDLSTYLNGQANTALVFDTLDYLTAQHIIPTVEISFMPELLASDPSLTVFHYKGGASPPSDWTAWRSFISNFTQLLVDRYSKAVVRTWKFEVWNEPNCGFYYEVGCCGADCGNQTAYFKLYAETTAAVKAVDQLLQVGGPATAQLGWIPEFLSTAKAGNTPVDFVSSHSYPTDAAVATRESFMDAIANATALAHAAGVPFLLTEFNAGLGNEFNVFPESAAAAAATAAAPKASIVPLLDSSYAAAFLLHCHLRAQNIKGLLSMSYWTFTDFGFEEQGVDPAPWNPGFTKFGIQTMYGVKKPSYRALQWLSDWRAGSVVPVKAVSGGIGSGGGGGVYGSVGGGVVGASVGSVDVMVAVADGGVVTVLLGNYDVADGTTPAPPTTTVTLTLTGLTGALPTNATLELIDDTHTNPYATWLSAGSPLYPAADEIAAEAATSVPVPMQLRVEAAGAGSVRVNVTLGSYAMARVRMVAVAATSATAAADGVVSADAKVAATLLSRRRTGGLSVPTQKY